MKAKDNPFRSGRIEKIPYCLRGLSRKALYARIQTMHFRGALVGAQGTGKTTLLEEIGQELSAQGKEVCSLRLTEENPSFSWKRLNSLRAMMHKNLIVLLDGADRMSRLQWEIFQRMTRPAGGMIITTHALKWLPQIFHCETDLYVLKEVLQNLLADAHALIWDDARVLFYQYDGNIRLVLRDLYESFAEDRYADLLGMALEKEQRL